MIDCLNPACKNPRNPLNNTHCHGCGESLSVFTQGYRFRLHYYITQLLGEGSFGRTYLAIDTDLMNEPRVIKKLITRTFGTKAEQDKIKELFLREAHQLYKISHPQIPKLYAYFEQDQDLYLVQEFIDGVNLYQEFKENGAFEERKIISLLVELLPVLDYIHQQNIIHRDIKPQNIMRSRKTGKLILIDFGASKNSSDILVSSVPGTLIYTPGYAAIEHQRGEASPISDIYSLGATCVRLLTGCFLEVDETGNFSDELYDEQKQEWKWKECLKRQNKSINHKLETILDTMLMSVTSQRYQSAREILDILNSDVLQAAPAPAIKEVTSQQNQAQDPNRTQLLEVTQSVPHADSNLTPDFLKHCEQELAHYIGPIARLIIEETLAKYPYISSQQIIDILSSEIPDSNKASQFKKHLTGE